MGCWLWPWPVFPLLQVIPLYTRVLCPNVYGLEGGGEGDTEDIANVVGGEDGINSCKCSGVPSLSRLEYKL
jgi:hypothetical protein